MLKSPGYGKSLTFDGRISQFSAVVEPGPRKGDAPPVNAAIRGHARTAAGLLEKVVAKPLHLLIGAEAGRKQRVEDVGAAFDGFYDLGFGRGEGDFEVRCPGKDLFR